MITTLVRSAGRRAFAYTHSGPHDERLDRPGPTELRIRPWPLMEHPPTVVLELGRRRVHALAFDGNGRLAVIVSRPWELAIWSHDTQAMLASRAVEYCGTGLGLAWSSSGELALTQRDRCVGLTADLDESWSVQLPYACSAEFSRSGTRLAIGSWQAGLVARLPSPPAD